MTDRRESATRGRVTVLSPSTASTFEDAAEWYEYAAPDHFWFEWRFRVLRRRFAALGLDTARPLRILDVGCGTGVLAQQVEAATPWTVDGADLNLPALEAGGPGRGRRFFYDVTDRKGELEGLYDGAFLCDVIEHLEDPGPVLAAVLWHLKPGAGLLINVPALGLFHSGYDRAVGHVRRYDSRTLKRELAGMPANVRFVGWWGLPLLPALAARRVLYPPGAVASDDVIRRGLVPPGRLSDTAFRMLMRFEALWGYRSPLGTSLVVGATKA